MGAWVRCPSEYKKSDGQQAATEYHGWETLLGDDDAFVCLRDARETGFGVPYDDGRTAQYADQQTEISQTADTKFPVTDFLKGYWICHENQVQDAVGECLVDGDEGEDWFECKHDL